MKTFLFSPVLDARADCSDALSVNPLVSVIIPAYNSECYLAEAIDSVISQDYRPIEIIVIDDGSTDGTAAIANSYGNSIRYIFQDNSGTSVARNHGVAVAQGDLLAFLDADDLWATGKLTQQVKAFQENPELELVFGHVQQFYSPDLSGTERAKINCPAEPAVGYLPSAMMVTPAGFSRIGRFDAALITSEFISWYARAIEIKACTHVLPQLVSYRRLHQNNKGRQQKKYNRELIQQLKDSLDRRRAIALDRAPH